jgi:putative transposase
MKQIIEAFPEDTAPRYLVRDRDGVYGSHFRNRIQGMGIHEVLKAPKSPWQNPFAERLIGSIRRECLNHVIVLGQRHLKWILKKYFRYYLDSRTHLALEKDAPNPRRIQLPENAKYRGDSRGRWPAPSLRTSRSLMDATTFHGRMVGDSMLANMS